MNKMQALFAFWYQFGWDAYNEASVPDDAKLPYITYEASDDNFDHPVAHTVTLWDRSTSWENIESMKRDIEAVIGRGGTIVSYDNGAMWIQRGTPFAQPMPDSESDEIRRIILNIVTEYID